MEISLVHPWSNPQSFHNRLRKREIIVTIAQLHIMSSYCETYLQFTMLFVKRKPFYVYLAGAFEYPGRDVYAISCAVDHHIRMERILKSFVGTRTRRNL